MSVSHQPTSVHLPEPKQIRDLLIDLLGREVSLHPAAPFAPGPTTPASVATYVDDTLTIRALIACDLELSAGMAAAIGLVPHTGAEAAIEEGALTDQLSENLYEVLNIAASMFNVHDVVHLKLHKLHPAGPPLDPHTRISTLTLGRREDLTVDIAGYGGGTLSVVLL